jgi:stress response protein SCP2
MSGITVTLTKGQSIEVQANGTSLSKVFAALGWDPADHIKPAQATDNRQARKGLFGDILRGAGELIRQASAELEEATTGKFDVDLSAFMLDINKMYLNRVYFGRLLDTQNGIRHSGDDLTGEGGRSGTDKERIYVNLRTVQPEVYHIDIWGNIFRAMQKHQHFGLIKNAFIRLVDESTSKEVCRFNLSDGEYRDFIAVKLGSLDKIGGVWMFTAAGVGTYYTSLDEIRESYGRSSQASAHSDIGAQPEYRGSNQSSGNNYNNQPSNYNNQPSNYNNQPSNYNNQPSNYNNRPNRLNSDINSRGCNMTEAVTLLKGAKVDLSKDAQGNATNITLARCGLKWNVNTSGGDNYDLDFFMVECDANEQAIAKSVNEVIFYNHKANPNKSVYVLDDNLKGGNGAGYDEEGFIKFQEVPADIKYVFACVSIYKYKTRKQNFGQVRGAKCDVLDAVTGKALATYDLYEDMGAASGVVVGRFMREASGNWSFKAMGETSGEGMRGILAKFGVVVGPEAD